MLDLSGLDSNSYPFLQLNQLYHPTGIYGQDTKKIVYCHDFEIRSKFLPIFLKEWFFLVDKNGYLIIDYQMTDGSEFLRLEKTMWWLWKGKFEIVIHMPLDEKGHVTEKKLLSIIPKKDNSVNKKYYDQTGSMTTIIPLLSSNATYVRFVCKKTECTLIPHDSINRWSFGIVTNGERREWLKRSIESIRKQHIPQYEIILCGKYHDKPEKDIRYIPFNLRDDKGWITRKKNIITDSAQYENLCIIHDRAIFTDNWFKKMKEYGNCFEYLTNKQLYKGIRAYDWLTLGGPQSTIYKMELLDYRDWDIWSLISGLEIISKKSILSKVRLNETMYWNEGEDIDLSFRMHQSGYIPRINDAQIVSLGFRHGIIPSKPFQKQIIIPDMLLRRIFRTVARLTIRFPFMPFVIEHFCKTKLYKKIIRIP